MGSSVCKEKRSTQIGINHDASSVWIGRFGNKNTQQCPLCKINTMRQKRVYKSKENWQIAYVRCNGDNNIENLLPICYKCALIYDKKKRRVNLVDISEGLHDKSIIY